MFNILVLLLLAAAAIAMARKGRARRKFRRYLKGRIDFELALGTLGGNTLTLGKETNTLTESAWLSSIKATWALIDFSPGTQDGPLWVGVAHSDYTSTEIEEFIEESGSWDVGNVVAKREVNRRLIRQVGVFANLSGSAAAADALNDGRPITTKCGWMLNTGQTVTLWVYNSGSGTLTTGAFIHVNGHANLWPA